MKKLFTFLSIIVVILSINLNEQNIFPATINAGFGTTTPSSPLPLQVGIGCYSIRSTNGTTDLRTYQTNVIAQIGTYRNHPFQLMANNAINQLVVMPNGNIGVGNGTPSIAGLTVDTKVGATNAIFGNNTTGVSIESEFPGIRLKTY